MTSARETRRSTILAVAGLCFCSTVWGLSWVSMKVAVRFATPADFAVIRIAAASLALLALMAVLRRRPRLVSPGRVGFIGVTQGLSQLLAVWALVSGAAGRSAVLMYTMPFWVVIFARPILKEKIGPKKAAVIGLALAGLVIVVSVPSAGNISAKSSLIAIVAGIVWASSTLATRRLHQHSEVDLLSMTTWQMVFGTVALIVIDLLVPSRPIDWSLTFVGVLVYLSLIANALNLFVWYYVLRVLPAGTASVGVLAAPVIGIISGWILLGERTSALEAMGLALMLAALAGLGLVEMGERRGSQVISDTNDTTWSKSGG